MIILEDKSKCCGCEACVQVCTKNCITMKQDSEGFFYPSIDTNECIDCGFCEVVCPFNKDAEIDHIEEAQKCKAKDRNDLNKSSSGGAFAVLARKIIDDGGAVFGMRMSESLKEAVSYMAENQDELDFLLGAKYVQGRVCGAYIKVETEIKSGRRVLFAGTPCQINALKLYLRQDYDNLICVDVVCHGVASPSLWDRCASYVEDKNKSKLKAVNFRFYNEAKKEYGIMGELQNGKTVLKDENYDTYMQLFYKSISLRPSCYSCKAKTLRISDITLGEYINDEEKAEKSTVVFLRSQKGMELFDSVKDNLYYENIPVQEALNNHTNENQHVKIIPQRASFFDDLAEFNFYEIEKKYIYTDTKSKFKKTLHSLIKG